MFDQLAAIKKQSKKEGKIKFLDSLLGVITDVKKLTDEKGSTVLSPEKGQELLQLQSENYKLRSEADELIKRDSAMKELLNE